MSEVWKSIVQLENRNGRLFFDEVNITKLAEEYETPLYVYSENRIRDNYRRLLNAYKKYYPKFKIYYAIKANNNPAIVSILRREGAGADCSCPQELSIAENCGMSKKDTLYSGVYNSNEELKYAIEKDVKINLEDPSQLDRLSNMKVPEFLSFRINPGIGSSGAEGLVFAGPDAKFGIIERDVKFVYEKAKNLGVKKFGIHMMTGSNILDPDYFEQIVEKLLDIAGPISRDLRINFEFIDIGGSLGIPYKPEQDSINIDLVARKVTDMLKKKLEQYNMKEPYLIVEPGRYLVCDAGILVTKVSSIKKGYKKFIGLDAGMNTLLRPAIYGSYHHILYANNLDADLDEEINVVGPICENTDQFAKDRKLSSKIKVGDVLVLLDAGAYGFGMTSQYNTRQRPAEILVSNGNVDIIREKETFEDLFRNIKIPKRLEHG